MSDLIAFIEARLTEDAELADAATAGPWRWTPDKHWRKPGSAWTEEAVFAGPAGKEAICVAGTGDSDDVQSMADAEFIASHDPARTVREVEAARRLLGRHRRATEAVEHGSIATYTRGQDDGYTQACADALRDLASVWAEHPDYRAEWRPDA